MPENRDKEFEDWLATCPETIKGLAQKYPPDIAYKVKRGAPYSIIDKIELFGKYTQGAKDEWTREVIKYLIGLPSKYQPPTKYRFYGDADNNQEIINTVIN